MQINSSSRHQVSYSAAQQKSQVQGVESPISKPDQQGSQEKTLTYTGTSPWKPLPALLCWTFRRLISWWDSGGYLLGGISPPSCFSPHCRAPWELAAMLGTSLGSPSQWLEASGTFPGGITRHQCVSSSLHSTRTLPLWHIFFVIKKKNAA